MNKKTIIVSLILSFCWASVALAYLKDYPPYRFKDGPHSKHLEAKLLVDLRSPEYKSKDGSISVKLLEKSLDTFEFMLQDGKSILINKNDNKEPYPYAVYWADLDKNGLNDFIVFYSYRTMGYSFMCEAVEIFLKKKEGGYQKISYDGTSFGLEDFVDLDNDGKNEVIITDTYSGDKHTYFVYNIYEFKNYKLLNANAKFKGFPKFIWFTYNANDKDTTHLTKQERFRHIEEINRRIRYQEIK